LRRNRNRNNPGLATRGGERKNFVKTEMVSDKQKIANQETVVKTYKGQGSKETGV